METQLLFLELPNLIQNYSITANVVHIICIRGGGL